MSAEQKPIRSREPTVFVVDDDPAVLDSMRLLLRSVGLPSAGYTSAADFLEAHDPETPGCVVLDLRMPGMGGMELQRRLQEMGSDIPIVFVTAHGDVPTAVEAVKAGAVDFIQKPFKDGKLLEKVDQALALDTSTREERRRRREVRARLDALTPREQEVMALVVAGRPNKTIARELGISRRTVEIHRARVMEKTGTSSVADLVQMVMSLP